MNEKVISSLQKNKNLILLKFSIDINPEIISKDDVFLRLSNRIELLDNGSLPIFVDVYRVNSKIKEHFKDFKFLTFGTYPSNIAFVVHDLEEFDAIFTKILYLV